MSSCEVRRCVQARVLLCGGQFNVGSYLWYTESVVWEYDIGGFLAMVHILPVTYLGHGLIYIMICIDDCVGRFSARSSSLGYDLYAFVKHISKQM